MTGKEAAIVTGGANGIGRETAVTFATLGVAVIIADRDRVKGEEVVAGIISRGGKAWFIECDVSKPDDIERLMSLSSELTDGIDILINNAGFGIWKKPDELQVEEWDAVINTNLRGAFLCSRGVIPLMRRRKGAVIINIGSTRAFMSEPNSEAYAASKGGIISLTHALAASLAPEGIRVNCISPGWIETTNYNNLRRIDHTQHFSGRVGYPSDIAKACVFIAENEFIDGENIIIDGGMTRKMIYEA